jgi:hypothetical protein
MKAMVKTKRITIDMPIQLADFRLPKAVEQRLHSLLDKQDTGKPLTQTEREEAEGLCELVDLLSLLRLRSQPSL